MNQSFPDPTGTPVPMTPVPAVNPNVFPESKTLQPAPSMAEQPVEDARPPVKMYLEGMALDVAPDDVEAHRRAGWTFDGPDDRPAA